MNIFTASRRFNCLRIPGVLFFAVFLSLALNGHAQDTLELEKEDPFRIKTLEGQIAGKTRRNLSLQHKQEGNQYFEDLIPIGDDMKFKGYKKFQDVNTGDTVRVEFKEYYQTDKAGKEVRTGKKATRIELMRTSTADKRNTTTSQLISKEANES